MIIETIRPWFDKTVNKVRSVGEVQEITEDRYKEIVATLKGHKDVEWVRLVKEYPSIGDMTVKDIKAELDSKEIEYDANAKKADLYALLTK